jgi:HEPN domain-containing protein
MRKESQMLWAQGLEDIDTADKLIGVKKFYASVFYSEQAAEKVLKALYIEKKKRALFTHDLTELAEQLNAPEEIQEAAAELSPDYVISRYPNAANAVPARIYTKKSADLHLKCGMDVIEWVKKELELKT